MFNPITTEMVDTTIKTLTPNINNLDKVVYHKIADLANGKTLCLVFGYQGGYGEGEKYQITTDMAIYTLCAKLAINIDDLQCDFDFDWYMPSNLEGDVYDTEMAVDSDFDVDWYNQQAKEIVKGFAEKTLTI